MRWSVVSDLNQAGSRTKRRRVEIHSLCDMLPKRDKELDEAVKGQEERQTRWARGRGQEKRRHRQGPSAARRLFRPPTLRADTISHWRYSLVERASREAAQAGLDGHLIALMPFLPTGQAGLNVSRPPTLRLSVSHLPHFDMHRTLLVYVCQRRIRSIGT